MGSYTQVSKLLGGCLLRNSSLVSVLLSTVNSQILELSTISQHTGGIFTLLY